MKYLTITILSFVLLSCKQSQKPAPQTAEINGRQLFSINCASCHNVHKDLTGPALAGVNKRWPDKEKLYRYIRNSQDVIQSDKYAMELYQKWNKSMMTPFPNLSDKEIGAILEYVESVPKPE